MMDENLFKDLHMMFVKFTMPSSRGIEEFLFDKNFRLISHEFKEMDERRDETGGKEEGNDEKDS